jgi:hypothetical protein
MNQVLTTIEEPARGPAADEGVRPTIDADGRNWENYVALATEDGPHCATTPKLIASKTASDRRNCFSDVMRASGLTAHGLLFPASWAGDVSRNRASAASTTNLGQNPVGATRT